jgi:membrane fusion protein (multidrug efflux system)
VSDSSSPFVATTVQSQKARARRTALIAVAAGVALLAAIALAYWFLFAVHYVSTDDAYVQDDIVEISAEVSGTATAVYVQGTQFVKKGQLLVSLDPADAKVEVATAEANLASAVRDVRGRFAEADQLRAQLVERETARKRAEEDLARRSKLLADGAVSGEELSHARDAVASANASVDATRESLNALVAQIQGTTVETHPSVLRAAAALRSADLALHRTQLYAPVDGVVAQRSIQVGHRVAAGQPLMALVPLAYAWVDANFKESQLTDMRIGQPVALRADIYGHSVDYHGRVVGFAAGTGTAFALLPAQNASGNWIKIVQRLPVRIVIDPQELRAHPLRVGLSMSVRVDIRNSQGADLTAAALPAMLPGRSSEGDDPGVDTRIHQIIRENSETG